MKIFLLIALLFLGLIASSGGSEDEPGEGNGP
jgi:hypothetical protein